MTASVGLAIPSLNQGAFVEEAIKSLLAQTGVDLRIALVDGGLQTEPAKSCPRGEADWTPKVSLEEGLYRYIEWFS